MLAALLHRAPASNSMQPAAVQASLSLGFQALSANLKADAIPVCANADIWGPVVGR